jgi:hypothetical protein
MHEDQDRGLGEAQRAHWQKTYAAHPGMYGDEPSAPAVHAAAVFAAAGARDLLELGAGHGRDASSSPGRASRSRPPIFPRPGFSNCARLPLTRTWPTA